jgi:hypothetical protein
MHATPTISVQPTASGFVATATFPHGFIYGRRPISGQPAGSALDAIASLLGTAALLHALSGMVTPRDYPDDDA